jgi:membrane protein implicated in regulation of membrane protease activity
MKVSHLIIILIVFAWPLYYFYQIQLGAVTFLLLAIFFLVVSIKEMKKVKGNKPPENNRKESLKQKIK